MTGTKIPISQSLTGKSMALKNVYCRIYMTVAAYTSYSRGRLQISGSNLEDVRGTVCVCNVLLSKIHMTFHLPAYKRNAFQNYFQRIVSPSQGKILSSPAYFLSNSKESHMKIARGLGHPWKIKWHGAPLW